MKKNGEKQMAKLNIYQKILEIMKDWHYVQKENKKVNNQYSFVAHDSVTGALQPLLIKHGVVCVPSVTQFSQEGNRTTARLTVKFVDVDNPNDYFLTESFGYGVDPSDKGPGKAVSYAFKYSILKLFCLETGDDPEKDATNRYEPEIKQEVVPEFSDRDFMEKMEMDSDKEEDLKEFLKELSKTMKVSAYQIKKQALDPQQKHLFIDAWENWLDA